MKFTTSLVALSAGAASLASASSHNPRHKAYVQRRDKVLYGRQAAAVPAPSPPTVSVASAAHSSSTPTVPPVSTSNAPAAAVPSSTGIGSVVPVSGGISATVSAPAVTTPTVPGTEIPPLAAITAGAPIETPLSMFTTFTAGASAPYTGAPPLPTIAALNPANYPPLDLVPPVDSPQVQQWLAEIDLSNVPNLQPTTDGSCASDPAFAADTTRCWWTCGGCTRSTDLSTCPTKLDWGVSYDDGPSPYTPKLVNYLYDHNITATFYTVGSRAISRPAMLQTEYMLGHEIADHTWSHHPLTTLTNAQIVAELGWTRQAIKDILGITPRFCRPPYGDMDDRVRGVMAAMNLIPVLWSGTGNDEFDTDDWRIAGGTANGTSSYAAWQNIVATAVDLATGFIVLQHDLYQQSVDMAVGYILPDALSHTPAFSLKSVIECQHQPPSNSYVELFNNATGGASGSGSGSKSGGSGGAKGSGAMSTISKMDGGMVVAVAGVAMGLFVLGW